MEGGYVQWQTRTVHQLLSNGRNSLAPRTCVLHRRKKQKRCTIDRKKIPCTGGASSLGLILVEEAILNRGWRKKKRGKNNHPCSLRVSDCIPLPMVGSSSADACHCPTSSIFLSYYLFSCCCWKSTRVFLSIFLHWKRFSFHFHFHFILGVPPRTLHDDNDLPRDGFAYTIKWKSRPKKHPWSPKQFNKPKQNSKVREQDQCMGYKVFQNALYVTAPCVQDFFFNYYWQELQVEFRSEKIQTPRNG